MRCPVCGGSLVADPQRGEVACAQCGLVVAESAVDLGPEWRVSNKEKRARTYPLKLVVKTDMAVRPEHGVQWRRLARFHKEALHSREWKLAEIGAELKRIRECAGLPQSVVDEAEALVKRHLGTVKNSRRRWRRWRRFGSPPRRSARPDPWRISKGAVKPRSGR
jgi:transcription initiation factor TFIIB